MAFFNYSTMQMTAKIVYYGPGLCGKTTNLQYIYGHTVKSSRGEMVSLETQTDRTLFFDLLPMEVGTVAGFKTKIQLYTVPGQVFYNTTRKLVLKGVDGVVFVADSQKPMRTSNVESLNNLEENLAELGLELEAIPLVLQYNKRDLPDVLAFDDLEESLNRFDWESYEASALTGQGVFETLRGVSRRTLISLRKQLEAAPSIQGGVVPGKPPAGPTASPDATQAPPAASVPIEPAMEVTPPPVPPAPESPAPSPPAAEQQVPPVDTGEVDTGETVDDPQPEGDTSSAETEPESETPAAEVLEPRVDTQRLRRDYLLRLPTEDFQRLKRLVVALHLEDDAGQVVRESRSVNLDIENPENLAEVLFQINLALRGEE